MENRRRLRPGREVTQSRSATTTSSDALKTARSAKLDPEARGIIAILLISGFVVILNETLMSVALPELMADLNISASTGQWVTTAFLLTMAVIIPITGMLMTRLPLRTLYLAAMGAFLTGTILGAVAPAFPILVVARVVQASGTAVIMPLLMTTVMTLVPPMMRGRIMGRVTIVISVAPALGPTISGLILTVLNWHWLFILMIPIVIAITTAGALRLRNVTETRTVSIDGLSILLTIVGFGSLVFGMNAVAELSSDEALINPIIPLVIGVVGMVLFVWRQKSLEPVDKALLDLRPLKSHNFRVSVILIGMSMMGLFGALFVLPIFAISVLGVSTLQIGLLLLPGGLVMGLLGPSVGRLYDRVGPRPLLTFGTMLTAGSFWGMSLFSQATPLWVVLATHVILSVGLAHIFTPLLATGLGDLPKAQYSYGTALFSTVQQLSGAAGTTMFATVLTLVTTSATQAGASDQTALAAASRTAFLTGAVISSLGIVFALMTRRNTLIEETAAVERHVERDAEPLSTQSDEAEQATVR